MTHALTVALTVASPDMGTGARHVPPGLPTIFSERELITFTFAICRRPSVRLSSVVCL